ncbi:MAG TPA: cysteine dioxygenase [Cytophagales bacterium]|nr:cysteine dioxygenase [Cytophagales bacterium]HAA24178.1 cysteine dioxygenase [Cytophagales bacterium]HAP60973.1 cysteine dioxygenase [Cytophagales bacterium]
MEIQTLPTSLNRLINNLADAFETEGKLNPARAGEILKAADIQEEDLLPFADFDHPANDCYGRKLVIDKGNFELMVMSWNPGYYSSIHNHGYTQWGALQVFGHVHHQIYCLKDGVLDFSKMEILPKGSIVKVNNALIHQMGNATSEPYITLHCYGANDVNGNVTADARTYELEHDRVVHTTGGAFFNVQEPAIYDFEKGPEVTDEVFMHYGTQLLRYYHRQEQTEDIREKKRVLCAKMEGRMIKQGELV